MTTLTRLVPLYDLDWGDCLPLPPELAALYGPLRFPSHPAGPYVISNFVSSLDGVVSLGVPGQAGGGEISGFNAHDRMLMGLLRAVADAVVVGAGTLRSVPDHIWTADYIYPDLAAAYQALRSNLGKSGPPLNVVVTARGELNPELRVFHSGEVPVLVLTSADGAARIRALGLPPSIQVEAVQATGQLNAHAILAAVRRAAPSAMVLVDGGPHLLGDFFAEGSVHEQFLTLAPQVVGRDGSAERPGLVAGRTFAPGDPRWGSLVSVKRGGDHLFLRYAFRHRV